MADSDGSVNGGSVRDGPGLLSHHGSGEGVSGAGESIRVPRANWTKQEDLKAFTQFRSMI